MKVKRGLVWLTIFLGALGLTGIVLAQVSPNFDLSWSLLSGGGGSRDSANYQLDDSLGQWPERSSSSASYKIEPGFWYGVGAATPPCLSPLSGVGVDGPTSGYTDTLYTFTAVITPSDATEPIIYDWSPAPTAGQGAASASYQWATPGVYPLTLTAENCGGTVTGTHTITISALPAGAGDAYEVDDTCGAASTIATDGTHQTHTFHDAGDQDWIKFTAEANKTYIIQTSNVGDYHDAVLFLYDACEAPALDSEDNAFGQTVRLEWNCTSAGTYYLMFQQHDPAIYGDDTNYDLSVTVDNAPPSAPKSPRSAPADQGLIIQWKRPPELDVVGYRIWYSTSPDFYSNVEELEEGGDTTYYALGGLTNGTLYYVAISAVDFSDNESDKSPQIANVPATPPDATAPSVTVNQPTTADVYTTSLSALTIGGSAQDTGGNLSRVKVRNVTNGSEGWDYSLAGSSNNFYVGNISLSPGNNDIEVTVYDDAGNEGSDSLTFRRLGESLGAVIIVAGHNETYGLQTNIYNAANNAYQVFQGAGFSDDDIYYLAPTSQDPDGDGNSEVDATATPLNLRDAITGTWAAERVGTGKPLYLYMMDHGETEYFCTDGCGSSGRTTSQDLHGWLNTLEANTGADLINVIIEACHSGSFIDRMQVADSISKVGRVVIVSTGRTNNAYASAQGAYFSDAFFSCVVDSNSLKTCYDQANTAVAITAHTQTPWLDDNGDGLSNPSDGTVAQNRYIASAFGSFRPEIKTVTVTVESGSGTLAASVERGAEEIDLVWAAVYPPSFQEPTTTTLDLGVPVVLLEADSEEEDLYTVTYPSGFTEEGTYRVVFYAQDRAGIHAQPELETVGEPNKVHLPVVLKNWSQ